MATKKQVQKAAEEQQGTGLTFPITEGATVVMFGVIEHATTSVRGKNKTRRDWGFLRLVDIETLAGEVVVNIGRRTAEVVAWGDDGVTLEDKKDSPVMVIAGHNRRGWRDDSGNWHNENVNTVRSIVEFESLDALLNAVRNAAGA